VRHHRSDTYSAEQVLLNKRQIYGGAPKVNCYPVKSLQPSKFSKFRAYTSLYIKLRNGGPITVQLFVHHGGNYSKPQQRDKMHNTAYLFIFCFLQNDCTIKNDCSPLASVKCEKVLFNCQYTWADFVRIYDAIVVVAVVYIS